MNEFAQNKNILISPTQFETRILPHGRLSVITPRPHNIQPSFVDDLIANAPWYGQGTQLGVGDERGWKVKPKRVELFTIGQTPIVLKETQYDEPFIVASRKAGTRASTVVADSIEHQIEIMDVARERYMQKYGEVLPLEEILGYYIDDNTKQGYLLYRYYEEIQANYDTADAEERTYDIRGRAKAINARLEAIGISFMEYQHMIIKDEESPKGYNLMLIDTELWRYDK